MRPYPAPSHGGKVLPSLRVKLGSTFDKAFLQGINADWTKKKYSTCLEIKPTALLRSDTSGHSNFLMP